jgi:hypothetical protein
LWYWELNPDYTHLSTLPLELHHQPELWFLHFASTDSFWLWWLDLEVLNITMVWKSYTFNRNLTLNFGFFSWASDKVHTPQLLVGHGIRRVHIQHSHILCCLAGMFAPFSMYDIFNLWWIWQDLTQSYVEEHLYMIRKEANEVFSSGPVWTVLWLNC